MNTPSRHAEAFSISTNRPSGAALLLSAGCLFLLWQLVRHHTLAIAAAALAAGALALAGLRARAQPASLPFRSSRVR